MSFMTSDEEARWARECERLAVIREEIRTYALPREDTDRVMTELRADLAEHASLARWVRRQPIRIVLLRRLSERTGYAGMLGGSDLNSYGDGMIFIDGTHPRVDVLHTFLHELGHFMHERSRGGDAPELRLDATIRDAFAAKVSAVCPMAAVDHFEYWAESFLVHWVERETLEERDSCGAKMVRDVLGLVGVS